MGKEKAGFLTPKAIANRIKAKGLQKLRWYCQMCQKQCRDENGFKCHLMSESHQRQLILFADNPDEYIDTFSKEFLDGYIELLSRQYGTKRVQANVVYQEYIHDRDHVHMNSTQWETLTEFVKWLGREGHCVVDETEKGWFVAYIDRNWEAIKKQESLQKKEKMELDDDERAARIIEKQIERDRLAGTSKPQAEATELLRENDEEKIAFNLGIAAAKKVDLPKSSVPTNALGKLKEDKKIAAKDSKSIIAGQKRKSALDELKEEEEQTKEKKNRKDYWLHTGIVVKVITKRLGDKYYKKKGVIKEVTDKYTGIVKLIDSGDKIKFDQEHLETVIPALGKSVLIVNGAYRGCEAKLDKLNEKNFSCSVTIKSGLLTGRFVEGIKYEDLSKLYQS